MSSALTRLPHGFAGEVSEETLYVAAPISTASPAAATASQIPTSLLVRYRENRFVLMGVDIHTGRVTITHTGTGGEEGTDGRLRVLEEKVNESPGMIVEYLLGLRFEVGRRRWKTSSLACDVTTSKSQALSLPLFSRPSSTKWRRLPEDSGLTRIARFLSNQMTS